MTAPRRRICFFHFFAFLGGAEKVSLYLQPFLAREIEAIALVPPGKLAEAYRAQGVAVEVMRLLAIPPFPLNLLAHATNCLLSFWYILRAWLRHRPAAIVAINLMAAIYALLGAEILHIPLILHSHDIFGGRLAWPVRLLASRCRMVIVDSQAVRENFGDLGARVDNVRVIYNGLDLKTWNPSAHERATARKALGLPPDAPIAATICQMAEWKGVEDFLAAAEMVLRDMPQAVFLAAGAPYVGGEEFLRRLKAQASAADPGGESIRLRLEMGGVPTLLAAANVVVQASRLPDPLPTIVLEAMAMERPVIGTQVGGIPEMVVPRVTGLLVPARDVAALAGAMREVLSDESIQTEWGGAGRRRVEQMFRAEQSARSVAAVIEECARSAQV
ncbi:MAG: glycosyltransferase family 4 protein [Armatimonadetes bacterium]|nr:glycosyltransferase family 4 protein [Armatimonadota bacterium]